VATGVAEAASAASELQVLPFKREPADLGFPLGGAVLLVALMAIAVGLVWFEKRRGRGNRKKSPWGALFGAQADTDSEGVRVLSSTRLDAATRVYALAWHDRQLLVAVHANSQPVVLDRINTPAVPEKIAL
jgi:hypothetical protein